MRMTRKSLRHHGPRPAKYPIGVYGRVIKTDRAGVRAAQSVDGRERLQLPPVESRLVSPTLGERSRVEYELLRGRYLVMRRGKCATKAVEGLAVRL